MFAISHGGNAPAIFQHPITESRLGARQDPSLILFSNWLATITRGIVTTGETRSFALVNFFTAESRLSPARKWLFLALQLSCKRRERRHIALCSLTSVDRSCTHTNTRARALSDVTFPTGALVSTWIALGIRNIRRTSYALITWEFQQSARRFEGAYTINFVVRV